MPERETLKNTIANQELLDDVQAAAGDTLVLTEGADGALLSDGSPIAKSAKGYNEAAQSHAVGTGPDGEPAAGSSRSWAEKVAAFVTGTSLSAREWAVGTWKRGVAGFGSAKDWATYTGGTVDDAGYSAKYHATRASRDRQTAENAASDADDYEQVDPVDGEARATGVPGAAKSAQVAQEAASRSLGSVYAQRVLHEPAVDWADLAQSDSPGQALDVTATGNVSFDADGQRAFVALGNTDPWSIVLQIDLSVNPVDNPLYQPGVLSYRLDDTDGALADVGPTPGTVTLELLNAAEVVLQTVTLAEFHGPAGEVVYEAAGVDPGAAKFVRLTISAQGGEGTFWLGHLAAGPFLDAGYLDQDAGDLRYAKRLRARNDEALPYALVAADDGLLVRLSGTGNLTLPSGLTGKSFTVLNDSSAVVTVVGSGVKLKSASGTTLAAAGTLHVVYATSTEAWISGDLS